MCSPESFFPWLVVVNDLNEMSLSTCDAAQGLTVRSEWKTKRDGQLRATSGLRRGALSPSGDGAEWLGRCQSTRAPGVSCAMGVSCGSELLKTLEKAAPLLNVLALVSDIFLVSAGGNHPKTCLI